MQLAPQPGQVRVQKCLGKLQRQELVPLTRVTLADEVFVTTAIETHTQGGEIDPFPATFHKAFARQVEAKLDAMRVKTG